MYLVWEILILGSLPPGVSIASVTEVLELLGGNRIVSAAVNVFSLFAIVTSFLGVGMGCLDFLTGRVLKNQLFVVPEHSLKRVKLCSWLIRYPAIGYQIRNKNLEKLCSWYLVLSLMSLCLFRFGRKLFPSCSFQDFAAGVHNVCTCRGCLFGPATVCCGA